MSCGDPDDIDCRSALDNLYAVMDEELSSINGDVDIIRQHIEECAPCLTEYEVETLIRKLLTRSCCEQAPSSLRARVVTEIRTVQASDSAGGFLSYTEQRTTIRPDG